MILLITCTIPGFNVCFFFFLFSFLTVFLIIFGVFILWCHLFTICALRSCLLQFSVLMKNLVPVNSVGFQAVCGMVPHMWTSWYKWCSLCTLRLAVASKWTAERRTYIWSLFPPAYGESFFFYLFLFFIPLRLQSSTRSAVAYLPWSVYLRKFLFHIVFLLRQSLLVHYNHISKCIACPSLPLISFQILCFQSWR